MVLTAQNDDNATMKASQPQESVPAMDHPIPCLIPAAKLDERVRELAREISADFAGQELLVVGVLHGAFIFMADLVRHLTIPVRCGFVMVSSYGEETETSGRVTLRLDLTLPAKGRHLLLVDDLVDTGVSTGWLLDHLSRKEPASVRLCVLLNKDARRRVPIRPDYVGFEIPNRFVVGYGIDCAHAYRELPYVGYIPTDESSPSS